MVLLMTTALRARRLSTACEHDEEDLRTAARLESGRSKSRMQRPMASTEINICLKSLEESVEGRRGSICVNMNAQLNIALTVSWWLM